MSESEPSSATFCVRNRDGDLLRAKGITILDSYSLVADVIAIRIRLQFCLENQIPNIIVESDSLTIVNIMNGFWKIPWRVTVEVNSIRKKMNSWLVRLQHFLREGNSLTDFLANMVFHFAGNFDFRTFQKLPSNGRKIIDMDKHNILEIRIR